MKIKAIGTESSNQIPMALCVYGVCDSWWSPSIGGRCGLGSIPSRRPSFSAPLAALTARGAYLGLAPKAGLVPAVILTQLLEESNGQNDLSQLPYRLPQVW